VTVSLWDVNDEATSELMSRFYREIFGKEKLTPSAALRRAQEAFIRDRRWNSPYFWATFVLQGEPE
jgi:CHAT domain-containing protein